MHKADKPNNQQGIVSIVITLILMLVISIVVLAFAKISSREQRVALDRQLSTQAFYAAESGVNEAVSVIRNLPAGHPGLRTPRMENCVGPNSFADDHGITLPSSLAGLNSAAYTCIFVNPIPEMISFQRSGLTHIFPLEDASARTLTSLNLFWDDAETFINGGCLRSAWDTARPPWNPDPWPANCIAPILRVELVNAADLTTSKVFFIYPSGVGNGSLDFTSSPTGSVLYGQCTDGALPQACRASIGLNATKYFVRVRTIMEDGEMDLTANVSGGAAAELIGAQAIVDVTGRATDVARRLQVRIKANNLGVSAPDYGVLGTSKVCKQFSLDGLNASDVGNCSSSGSFPD